jgi:aminomethyltransferase
MFTLAQGDSIAAVPLGVGQNMSVLVFDDKGRLAPQILGLKPAHAKPVSGFDESAMKGWIARNGGSLDFAIKGVAVPVDELIVFGAKQNCTVWVLRPVDAAEFVQSPSLGLIEISHKSTRAGTAAPLPPLLGEVRDEFTVSRGTAQAYEVKPGEVVQIIDVEGQQCSDFMALRLDRLEAGIERGIDSTATRSIVRAHLSRPRTGGSVL